VKVRSNSLDKTGCIPVAYSLFLSSSDILVTVSILNISVDVIKILSYNILSYRFKGVAFFEMEMVYKPTY